MLVRGLCLAAALAALLLMGAGSTRALPNASAQGDTQGDVNCDSTVNSIDSLQILRSVAGLSGSAACLADAGDVNCDDAVNSVDSLRILRYVAGLTNTTPDGCVPVGEALQLPPTSEELIAAALTAGEITYEESLWYRALALYDLPGLPEEYRSPVVDYHAAMGLFAEVLENQATLPQQLLEDIEPFMARPADPVSIFNNPPQPDGRVSASGVNWYSEPAAGGRVRVWATGSGITIAQHREWVDVVNEVWPQLQGVFRYGLPDTPGPEAFNPDNAIDIYLAPVGTLDPRKAGCDAEPQPPVCVFQSWGSAYTGYAAPYSGNTSASYIMVDPYIRGTARKSMIAHELVHVGQHAYDIWEPLWLKDATAEWGAQKVLIKLGLDQDPRYDKLPEFFDGLHQTLTRDVGDNRYGSWLYFLFASMEQGDGIVTSIWEQAAADGKQNEDAVDLVFPFADNFGKFTMRNWNQDPVDPLYRSPPPGDPRFSMDLKPDVDVEKELGAGEDQEITHTPVALSALYYRYTFKDAVRKIKFTNEVSANRDAHIWAIPKIGDEWQEPEDWSREQETGYCRDNPEEDLTEVIIILSNSHKRDNLPGGTKLKVEPEASACQAWEGNLSVTGTIDSPLSSWNGTFQAQATVRFEPSDSPHICNVEAACWAAVSGSMDWSESGMWDDCPTEGHGSGTHLTGNFFRGELNVFYVQEGVTQDQPPYDGYAYFDYGVGTNVRDCPDEDTTTSRPFFGPDRRLEVAPYICDGHPVFRLSSPEATTMSGSCTLNQPGEQEHTATWTWILRRAP